MIFPIRNVNSKQTLYVEGKNAYEAMEKAKEIVASGRSKYIQIKEEERFLRFSFDGALFCTSKERNEN